jgi:purine-cytosine permease-like protein
MIVFIVLYAVGASHFETSMSPPIVLKHDTQIGDMLSFMSIMFGTFAGWVAISADYYIYFPVSTPSWKIFLMSFIGIFVIPAFAMTCGAGFATALWTNEAWATEWASDGTSAGL